MAESRAAGLALGPRLPASVAAYGVGVPVIGVPLMVMPTGIRSGCPVVSTSVPKTTAGVSPAPQAVWTTSSS
jgi:hypothetical protein